MPMNIAGVLVQTVEERDAEIQRLIREFAYDPNADAPLSSEGNDEPPVSEQAEG